MTATPVFNSMQIKAADSPSIDAFGRWRVSNPETLFDSKQLVDAAPLVWDDQEVSGSGTTSTYSKDRASTTMGVTANTAGRHIRQTFMRFNYQPGKSHLVFATFVLQRTGAGAGLIRLVGYGDDDNGLFVCDNEGTIQLLRRSHVTGATVDDAFDQADWNLDKFDGTGTSGVTLDFTKSQILMIDFEWLGVGRVRFGFVVDGLPIYAHEFLNANNIDNVYMSTPNLPMRYEISNDGTGEAASLEHICSSVVSEGGAQDTGVLKHFDSGAVSSLVAGSDYAILGGRLKTTHFSTSIDVLDVSMLIATNDSAHWELRLGGAVAGTFTFVDVPETAVQIAIGTVANTYTGGLPVSGGFITKTLPLSAIIKNALRMGSFIDGTAQEWFLVVKPIGTNLTLYGSVGWREQT